jgi:hypothetical protein
MYPHSHKNAETSRRLGPRAASALLEGLELAEEEEEGEGEGGGRGRREREEGEGGGRREEGGGRREEGGERKKRRSME